MSLALGLQGGVEGLCVLLEETRVRPAQPSSVHWREGRGRQEVEAGMRAMVLVP